MLITTPMNSYEWYHFVPLWLGSSGKGMEDHVGGPRFSSKQGGTQYMCIKSNNCAYQ